MDLKKPYSINEQIEKLKEHGVIIDDVEFTKRILQQVSYYRLSGYMLQYRINPNNSKLVPGVKFADIYAIYQLFNKNFLRANPEIRNNTLFAYCLMLIKRLPTDDERKQFRDKLNRLVKKYENIVDFDRIGFPREYRKMCLTMGKQ